MPYRQAFHRRLVIEYPDVYAAPPELNQIGYFLSTNIPPLRGFVGAFQLFAGARTDRARLCRPFLFVFGCSFIGNALVVEDELGGVQERPEDIFRSGLAGGAFGFKDRGRGAEFVGRWKPAQASEV